MKFINKLDNITVFILGIVLVVSALLAIFGYYSYPEMGWDSSGFIPVAINYEKGLGLINQIYWFQFNLDFLWSNNFLYYPPLFPIVVGFFMLKATPQSAYMVIAGINIATIWLATALFLTIAKQGVKKINISNVFLIGGSIIGLASMMDIGAGRPETLARFFMILAAWGIYFYIQNKKPWWFLGSILGLMIATHLIGAIYLSFLIIQFIKF